MKYLTSFLLLVCTAASAQTTHGNCSPTFGTIGGNAVVNICPGDRFSSAQEAFFVASHPTTVTVADLQFKSWFEDATTPFLTVVLDNKSDVPALDVSVDVLNERTGSSYPVLRPFKLNESGVFKRLGARAISIAANQRGVYPLLSVPDLWTQVHPDVSANYCPYDASTSLIDMTEASAAEFQSFLEHRVSGATSDYDNKDAQFHSKRGTQEIGTLLRIRYRTIFDQRVTSYAVVFIHYADTTGQGDVWYPSRKAVGSLRCINRSMEGMPVANFSS
ncbi:hypothetical protein SAMN02787142_3227 [Burkholderia sp. WP9]|uniref:hypothetical protein n=1 Tax=Burkholderia sp. WP9 TaxID=1500263 RepID=UPI00089AD334|nr:hypothetical protein [Burkholderia sp. WP9]SED47147.1 hypothetical protein SAMN02787142_3227 [Burkholderia sp. WP9]